MLSQVVDPSIAVRASNSELQYASLVGTPVLHRCMGYMRAAGRSRQHTNECHIMYVPIEGRQNMYQAASSDTGCISKSLPGAYLNQGLSSSHTINSE